MVSRSRAPSGTRTNRSRGSCGWSTRTSAKVGAIYLNMFIVYVSVNRCFAYITNLGKVYENTPFQLQTGSSEFPLERSNYCLHIQIITI